MYITIKKLFIFSFFFLSYAISQQTAKKTNPTIYLNIINLDEYETKCLRSTFYYCGWFKLSNNKNADYILTISKGKNTPFSYNLLGRDRKSIPAIPSLKIKRGKTRKLNCEHFTDYIINLVYKHKKYSSISASKIAFSAIKNNIREIYIVDMDSSNLNQKSLNNNLSIDPVWSPDNNLLLYTSYGKLSHSLILQNIAERKQKYLFRYNGSISGKSFHPAGKHLALSLSNKNNINLFLLSIDNPNKIQQLTRESGVASESCWSPKGDKICYVYTPVYSNGTFGKAQLKLFDLKTKTSKKLFNDNQVRTAPDWHPNNMLCYTKGERKLELTLFNLTTNKERTIKINTLSGNLESPSWAPDGRHIVCIYNNNKQKSLVIIDTLYNTHRFLNIKGVKNFSTPSWSTTY